MSEQFDFISLDAVLWMLIAVVSFWGVPKFKMQVLTGIALMFLIVHDPASALILLLLTCLTYYSSREEVVKGWQLIAVIVLIFSVLMYYKIKIVASYSSFLDSEVLVPMGISYYTLRCIHFVMERYKNKIPPQSMMNLACYLFFLPTLWIGPIHRYESFDKDRRRHRWNSELFSLGLERLLYGYAKVVIVANLFLNGLLSVWIDSLSSSSIWLATYWEMVQSGLILYMLFSGYSDIAIGFGYLLGFKTMENFRFPFFQKNISAFWKSWHISLTSWCREYIYNTVVAQTRRPELGVIVTLLVIALWHEVSLRYLLWGVYHGLGILCWQKYRQLVVLFPEVTSRWLQNILLTLSVLLTVHYVWLGFVLVQQPDISSMLSILRILFFMG